MNYYRPGSLKKALNLLNSAEKDIVPLYYPPRGKHLSDWGEKTLMDMSEAGLNEIKVQKKVIVIGSMVSLEELVSSEIIRGQWNGVLSRAASLSTTLASRNLATVGGVLLNPCNPPEVMTVLLALDAVVTLIQTDGKVVHVPVATFLSDGCPALPEKTLIRDITLPIHYRINCVMDRVSRTEKDTSIVCVVVRGNLTQKTVHDLRIAVSGANSAPKRFLSVEDMISEKAFTVTLINDAAKLVKDECEAVTDFRGSAEYRTEMAETLVRRALLTLRKKSATRK